MFGWLCCRLCKTRRKRVPANFDTAVNIPSADTVLWPLCLARTVEPRRYVGTPFFNNNQ